VQTGFRWGDVRERGTLEDLVLWRRITLKKSARSGDEEAWFGLIWLRIGTGGGRF